MLLSEVVAASAAVARSPARRTKIDEIAGLLTRTPPDEVPIAVAFLSGELTQRQIGVGYAALLGLPERAASDVTPGNLGQAAPDGTAVRPSITLTVADAVFAAIGMLTGPGSQAERRAMLGDLLGRATSGERQFLIRLLAGDLGQGALEGVMIEAVARAAGVPAAEVRRAHQVRGSLPQVARAALAAVSDGCGRDEVIAVLREFTLQVGQPVRPMLAASAPSLDAALDRIRPAALEWKIDGIRIQIHRAGHRVQVFTRTLDEITDRVPELVAIGLALDADSAVIDGEAVALREDGRPYPFQVTSARAASQSAPAASGRAASGRAASGRAASGRAAPARTRAAVPLTAFLFDALHVNGHDLMALPASDRFSALAAIAPAEQLIPRLVTADSDLAAGFFADAIARGHEGVVVKFVQAPYGAGRRGGDWIKVKPRTTLDLVILAAEWGHGRRSGKLSNLHLGARDPRTGLFVMLGKTFKGLTDAMLAWQTEHLLALAEPPAADPGAASGSPAGQRYGVVRVRPELVAEIAFDGVQASSRYPGGVTLRFARVLRYRPDKGAGDADTIDTVRALWPHAVPG